jgi:hypothetical protein
MIFSLDMVKPVLWTASINLKQPIHIAKIPKKLLIRNGIGVRKNNVTLQLGMMEMV